MSAALTKLQGTKKRRAVINNPMVGEKTETPRVSVEGVQACP